jgi:biotin operon repressor
LAIEKEASIERHEQMLLREQEAINKQLDVLKASGFEISKTKEYLKKKLSEVEAQEPKPKKIEKPPKIESMASVMEEVPEELTAPEAAKSEETAEAPVAKVKQALFAPVKKEKDKKEDFFRPESYSELNEIKSMIEVALQQGDALPKIKQSLLDSGYSKANVEKALRELKTVKS